MPYYCFKLYHIEYDYGGNVDVALTQFPVLDCVYDTQKEANRWLVNNQQTSVDDLYTIPPTQYAVTENYTDYSDVKVVNSSVRSLC